MKICQIWNREERTDDFHVKAVETASTSDFPKKYVCSKSSLKVIPFNYFR